MYDLPLTIFTIPKQFKGYWGTMQMNALRSWKWAAPDAEIFMMTNEQDAAAVAAELGIRHIPEVRCNEFGTPLIDSVFEAAYRHGRGRAMMYVNADIIFPQELDYVLKFVPEKQKVLISGLRHSVLF